MPPSAARRAEHVFAEEETCLCLLLPCSASAHPPPRPMCQVHLSLFAYSMQYLCSIRMLTPYKPQGSPSLFSHLPFPSPAAHDAELPEWDPSAIAPLRSSTSCFLTARRDRPCLPRLPFKASACSLILL